MNFNDKTKEEFSDYFKRANKYKKQRNYFLAIFPKDILEVDAGNISLWDYGDPDLTIYPPRNTSEAEQHQWALQTVKLAEANGFVFPEKPEFGNASVSYDGKKEIEYKDKKITLQLCISGCPVPPGCVIRKGTRHIPAHEEPFNYVSCLEDERNALNTPVEA